MALPEMTPGGAWMSLSADKDPVYVPHDAHIKRLLSEGAQIVADPRQEPVEEVQVAQPAPSVEATLRAELEALKAQMQQFLAAQQEAVKPAPADAPASPDDNSKPVSKRGK